LEPLSPGSDSLVNCRCKDGTTSPRCCKKLSSRGKRVSSRRSTPARSPFYSTLGTVGSGATGRRVSKLGKHIAQLGFAQMANAQFSQPPSSGKIWVPMTKKEMKTHRPQVPKKDYKKYDFQPKGNTLRGSMRDSRIGTRSRRGNYRYGEWESHWQRRPHRGGIYSVPSQLEVQTHRKSQTRKGFGKVSLGSTMRMLGNGLMVVQLGVYASWLYDDPSEKTVTKIVKDFTLVEQIDNTFWQPLQRLSEIYVKPTVS
jgi:hypothetical protein